MLPRVREEGASSKESKEVRLVRPVLVVEVRAPVRLCVVCDSLWDLGVPSCERWECRPDVR